VVEHRNVEQTASRRQLSVTNRSGVLGVGSPLGWLCATMIATAFSTIATRKTSRGITSVWLTVPRETRQAERAVLRIERDHANTRLPRAGATGAASRRLRRGDVIAAVEHVALVHCGIRADDLAPLGELRELGRTDGPCD
jgi:hypothetical protein